jgi:hypothetical protein
MLSDGSEVSASKTYAEIGNGGVEKLTFPQLWQRFCFLPLNALLLNRAYVAADAFTQSTITVRER